MGLGNRAGSGSTFPAEEIAVLKFSRQQKTPKPWKEWFQPILSYAQHL